MFDADGRPTLTAYLNLIVSMILDEESGVFVATVPALPGCVGEGVTREKARADIKDAVEQVLEAHAARGTSPVFVEPREYVEPSTLETVQLTIDGPEC